MIGCLRTYVRKQPIIALYFEFGAIISSQWLERSHSWPKLNSQIHNLKKLNKISLEAVIFGTIAKVTCLSEGVFFHL